MNTAPTSPFVAIFEGRVYSPAQSPEDAIKDFNIYAQCRDLRGSTYKGTIIIDSSTREVVGYISMNGRYWTRENGHGTTPDKLNWDLQATRYWNSWIDKIPSAT